MTLAVFIKVHRLIDFLSKTFNFPFELLFYTLDPTLHVCTRNRIYSIHFRLHEVQVILKFLDCCFQLVFMLVTIILSLVCCCSSLIKVTFFLSSWISTSCLVSFTYSYMPSENVMIVIDMETIVQRPHRNLRRFPRLVYTALSPPFVETSLSFASSVATFPYL